MPAFTTRMSLYKPGGGSSGTIPDEQVDIDKLNGNFDALDAAIGVPGFTSTSRPSTPYDGQLIKETDTKRIMRYSQSGSIWEEIVSPAQGLTAIKPTSVVNGTVGPNGVVTFTAATKISVVGAFTSQFDNYLVLLDITASSAASGGTLQMRAAAADDSSANYSTQQDWDKLAVHTAQGVSAQTSWAILPVAGAEHFFEWLFSAPALTRATKIRSIAQTWVDTLNAVRSTVIGRHNVSTAFDGFSYTPSTGNITGTMRIFGYNNN